MNNTTITDLRDKANEQYISFCENSEVKGEYTLISPYSSIPAVMYLQEEMLRVWKQHSHFYHVCDEDDGEFLRGYIEMTFSLAPDEDTKSKIIKMVQNSFERWSNGELDNDAYIEQYALGRRTLESMTAEQA